MGGSIPLCSTKIFTTFTPSECGTSNINDHSVVIIVEYLGVKVFIPGDNEAGSWKEFYSDAKYEIVMKKAKSLPYPYIENPKTLDLSGFITEEAETKMISGLQSLCNLFSLFIYILGLLKYG